MNDCRSQEAQNPGYRVINFMIMFYVNNADKFRFLEYLRANGLPDPKPVGKSQKISIGGASVAFYQHYKLDAGASDFTAFKLLFDIRLSLF